MKKKNVIVTGGTKGIGLAIIELLAAEGYNVGFGSRTESDVKDLQEKLQVSYPEQLFISQAVDVSDKDDLQKFADYMLSEFDVIHALVNNAGVFLQGELLLEDESNLEIQLNTNVYSAYRLSRAIAPRMVEQGHGDIINMSSIAGIAPYPNAGSYCISKFAMRGFGLVLREELKEKGVRVTNILPGGTWSDSWAGVELPEDRLMPAIDIAKAVLMAIELDASSVLEEIVLRPQLGDL